jgi:hypothetical protein
MQRVWGGGGEQNAYKKMAVKPERKTLLGRSRRRCEYNIEMNITKRGMNLLIALIWLRTGTGNKLM